MKCVIQRSLSSDVKVNNTITGKIDNGLVIFVAFTYNDTIEDIKYMIKKIINLRIFDDENKIMNLSLKDINGSILSISQFTLYADTKKGNRPSYSNSLNKEEAIKLYDLFNNELINNITDCFVEKNIRELEKPSDHVPMTCLINL